MTKINNEIADPLLDLNLKVAAIAGWENIQEWNPNPKTPKIRKVFQGTNKKHPELGIFVPEYVRDLNAIVAVFVRCMGTLGCHFQLDFAPSEYYSPPSKPFLAAGFGHHVYDESPAIALCKLLLKLAPDLDDDLCQKTYGQAVEETQPELDSGDFEALWSYRVSKQTMRNGAEIFAIREFYGTDCNTWAEGEIAPSGDSLEDLRWVLTKMLEALDKPVIDIGRY